MDGETSRAKHGRVEEWIAFGLLYVVWGSTYFAIRIAVRSWPPFSAAGLRFVIAGGLPLLVLRARGEPWPSARQWRNATIVGGCLMLGGNGLVTWAEQTISSSLAALLVAVTPMWFVVLEALRPGGVRPTRRTLLGLAIGFCGVALLIGPDAVRSELGAPPLFGLLLLMLASILWAFGSLFGKHSEKPRSLWMASALQMLCGGGLLIALALALGEPARIPPAAFGAEALGSLVYLIVAGSWLGFGSYVWLLDHVPSARLSTYAFVNPLVAVVLGVSLLHEPWSLGLVWSALLILGGIVVIQFPVRAAR
jgi:drug/metabolite transporter (DMT)-like permease